jgi:RNA polymerase sigma-70 factor (ECF subfamily)
MRPRSSTFRAAIETNHRRLASNSTDAARSATTPRDLERRRAYDEACRYWSLYTLPFEAFCEHLSQLGYGDGIPAETRDVLLCAACGAGCNTACTLLEAKHFANLRRLASRIDARAEAVDELLQLVRDRLFVGPRARIRTYEGRGPLAAWLRAVARSVMLDRLRAERRLRTGMILRLDMAPALMAPVLVQAPSQRMVSQRDLLFVEGALTRALRELPAADRQLLRNHYVLGLGIDPLARLYGIDRSTVARRIIRVIRRVRSAIRAEMIEEFGMSETADMPGWAAILSEELGLDATLLLVGHDAEPAAAPCAR